MNMKKFLNTVILLTVTLASAVNANAQGKFHNDWKDKIMSEKVAFLTIELDITPEEAQAFWAVYNKVGKELDQARHDVMSSYKQLSEAIAAKKPEKEISQLLDKYIQAKIQQDKLDNAAVDSYKAVLPVEKVAKLYVAEEKFRRQYIHKLHHKPEEKK